MKTENEIILSLESVVKRYPKVLAVNNLSLQIPRGLCFGFLGPNGAGKTTTIEIMEGILPPDSGRVLCMGEPIDSAYVERIGIAFQTTALQEKLRCREVLEMFAALYKQSASIDSIIERCQLGEFIGQQSTKLSGGQRQRLLLAIALINNPEILFLDEPTTGLDPQARKQFWDLIHSLKQEEKTIILTTHYMEEAHYLCDELVIINHGEIVDQGSPHQLLDKTFNGSTIRFPQSSIDASRVPPEMNAHTNGRFLEMHVPDTTVALQKLLEVGIDCQHITVQRPTLEDLFLHLTATGNSGGAS